MFIYSPKKYNTEQRADRKSQNVNYLTKQNSLRYNATYIDLKLKKDLKMLILSSIKDNLMRIRKKK